jgi:uncharacterized membrane protein
MLELKHRIISTITLLVLDIPWIMFVMGPKYEILIKNIQNSKMETNRLYIFVVYLLMIIGLNKFVLPLINIKDINIYDCLSIGGVFGIILYGIYDFTAAAVLKKWDMGIALIDILWGGFVCFCACYVLKFVN